MGSPISCKMKDEAAPQDPPKETTSLPPLPSAPDPSDDLGVVPPIKTAHLDMDPSPEDDDIFLLKPVVALKMLCRSIDALVSLTGDIPPTPPVKSRNVSPVFAPSLGSSSRNGSKENFAFALTRNPEVPGIETSSPEAHHHGSIRIVGANAEPVSMQQGAIARKFYSKRPPPISTEDYLMRMHRYCPMSTAVYLATSSYINRLAMVQKVIPVTPRNVHRLLLAGLRVAMKALEDRSYPHTRFAKVGGVSELELGRLEITFCFLTNFELKVDAKMLQEEASSLRQGLGAREMLPATLDLTMPKDEKRIISLGLSRRALIPAVEAPS